MSYNPRIEGLERKVKTLPTGGSVPVPSAEDEGKIIAVNSAGKYALETAPTGLPSYTNTDIGKVLSVIEGSDNAALAWVEGNPNSVQVINGTMADPWGEVGFDALYGALPFYNDDDSIVARNATAIMLIDGTALGMGTATVPLHSRVISSDDIILGDGFMYVNAGFLASTGYWKRDGLYAAYVISGSSQDETYTETEVTAYASQIPTTLTIIWHPMPTP